MLCAYLITVILLGCCYVQGALIKNDNQNPNSLSNRLAEVIHAKCSKNANEIKYQEVLKQLDHLNTTCWNSILPDLLESKEKNIEECRENVPGVVECVTKFVEKLESCLEPEELFLKQFVLGGYQKHSEFLCEHINVLSFPELLKTNTVQCMGKFVSDPKINPHYVCYAKSDVFGDHCLVDAITKSKLCQDLNNVRSCYEEMFDEHCPDAPEIKALQLGTMKAALAQCSEE